MSLQSIPFTDHEHRVLTSLGGWMLFIAILHIIGGAIGLIGTCLGTIGSFTMVVLNPLLGIFSIISMLMLLVMCGVALYQGVLLIQTRGSLSLIVTTDQSDQLHLGDVFKRLKLFFLVELVFGGLALLNTLLNLIKTLAFAPAAASGMGGFQ